MNLSAVSMTGQTALQSMAVSQQSARRRFVEYVQDRAGLTETQAYELAALYRKNEVLALCATSGRFQVQHPALLDPAVIAEAVAGRLFPAQACQGEC